MLMMLDMSLIMAFTAVFAPSTKQVSQSRLYYSFYFLVLNNLLPRLQLTSTSPKSSHNPGPEFVHIPNVQYSRKHPLQPDLANSFCRDRVEVLWRVCCYKCAWCRDSVSLFSRN
ncbi:hypothetical protein L873DRAFT_1496273 [Choiromyces venosus 120613-1]|uniref:Secreted protein n=1 Tax=Choiromyces venosus 120613-1 TaxID=1336337 RepID=A0A3N4J6K4_9PEZI|nr:hypothetical protein L873DRAFT_1496273 [Choiromyces venosus 120613-1]